MRVSRSLVRVGFVLSSALAFWTACSSDETTGPAENTGSACTNASQCYPGVADAGALKGAALCLDRVAGGYCTHECTTDADCCAVEGECRTGYKQVCAPFESTGKMMCFLSCEEADVTAAPGADTTDPALYCQHYANEAFGCRSTGGGSKNRKVCVP